jgi:hypothetical protein
MNVTSFSGVLNGLAVNVSRAGDRLWVNVNGNRRAWDVSMVRAYTGLFACDLLRLAGASGYSTVARDTITNQLTALVG